MVAIETLGKNSINQIESLANSLPNQEEGGLILAFLQNPIIASKIEQTPSYVKSAKTQQERDKISGEIAGWAFKWLSFTYLLGKTKHTLLSPQNILNLYQILFPDKKLTDFFFQGRVPVNTRVPDMLEVRNAGKTLQIIRIIEAKAGGLDDRPFTAGNLYGNLQLKGLARKEVVGEAMHDVMPGLEAKPAYISPHCKVTLAVPGNPSFESTSKSEIIPISSATLFLLERTITSGSI